MESIKIQGNKMTISFPIVGDVGQWQLFESLVLEKPDRDLTPLDGTLGRTVLGSYDGVGITIGNRLVNEVVTFGSAKSSLHPKMTPIQLARHYHDRTFWNV